LSILNFGPRCPNEQHVGNFFEAQYLSIALESGKVVLGNPPQNVLLLDFGLGPPSRESQPISNQPICKIEVPAFRGVGNSHNKSLKKLVGNRYTVTPQRFNSNKRICHYSDNLNLTSEPFGT
jgi:hypothetical protein